MSDSMWIAVDNTPHGFHIFPENDCIDHDITSNDCVCDPDVEYIDDTGRLYPRGPLVVHRSVEGEEDFPHQVAVESMNAT